MATVLVEDCDNYLILSQSISKITKCALNTAINITNSGKMFLLNSGSPINSEEQWENIVKECNDLNCNITWHYMD